MILKNNLRAISGKFVALLLFHMLFIHSDLFAQANTLVMGKITNVSLVKKIDIQVNQKFFNNNIEVYSSNILEDGTFAFAVEINEPQVVTLLYSRNPALIYLEPNDTLLIESDANSFQYSLNFSGRSGHNNKCFYEYLKENPSEMDPLKLAHYRKGNYYYVGAPEMDNWMQSMNVEAFNKKMMIRREKALADLSFYQQNNKNTLTTSFQQFLQMEIYYDWAYHMMFYGTIYKNVHQLDQNSFFTFLEEVPIQQEQIGNYWYRQFLFAYFNHQQMKSEANNATAPYVQQYQLADNILVDKAKWFYQSEMIKKSFSKKNFDAIIPHYIYFLEHNPYLPMDDKVVTAYQKALIHRTGATAPEIALEERDGTSFALSNLQGKSIYLNFWASWCKPCIKKMQNMRTMEQEFEEQGLIFVNISLDRDRSIWEKTIDENQFGGIHILAPDAEKSSVTKQYEVKALPQYFLINKFGKFAEKPKTYDLYEIRQALKELVKY